MSKITPFLWFDHQAEEAVSLYTSLFKNSKVLEVARYGDAGPGTPGSVMTIHFVLDGQEFTALNGGPYFTFTGAISFYVNCETQEELDFFWEKLSEGGQVQQCGWLTDKFGITWQIVPAILGKLMSDPDPEKARRVTEAMLKMIKLDIAGLQKAYDGA